MVLRKSIVLFACFFSLLFTSCLDVAKELNDWTKVEDINTIEGNTHYLGDDGIKIFLPSSFKRYSTIEYLSLIDSLVTNNKDLELERTRIKYMREMEGNHYIYFDPNISATFNLNVVPYQPITRQDAKFILGIIRESQRELETQTDLRYEKITAKHNANEKTQVFKAIFKINNPKIKHQIFQHAYFISSNKKTIMINLIAPFEIHFDPFIEKIIM